MPSGPVALNPAFGLGLSGPDEDADGPDAAAFRASGNTWKHLQDWASTYYIYYFVEVLSSEYST